MPLSYPAHLACNAAPAPALPSWLPLSAMPHCHGAVRGAATLNQEEAPFSPAT